MALILTDILIRIWNDEAYRTGLLHKHNVSITGGAENVKYMASAGYLGQTGILPNSDRKQFNGRTNLDMQLTKKAAVRMNMSFIRMTSRIRMLAIMVVLPTRLSVN